MTEESLYLSFSGIRVHFRVVRPDVPIRSRIMLLASPMICAFHWRKLLPELSGLGCLAVLVDLPGFGHGDPSAPQDADVRANLIWGILDEVDRSMETPLSLWHLAGHGTACATVLHMGALYPDSVKSQIHLSPLFSVDKLPMACENISNVIFRIGVCQCTLLIFSRIIFIYYLMLRLSSNWLLLSMR